MKIGTNVYFHGNLISVGEFDCEENNINDYFEGKVSKNDLKALIDAKPSNDDWVFQIKEGSIRIEVWKI